MDGTLQCHVIARLPGELVQSVFSQIDVHANQTDDEEIWPYLVSKTTFISMNSNGISLRL